MTKAARETRREYHRKWQRENPDRVKEYQRRYWEKQAERNQADEAIQDKAESRRINIELTAEQHDYLKTVTKMRGMNFSMYVRALLMKDMIENREVYAQIKEIREGI